MNLDLKNIAVTAFAAQSLEGDTWQSMCRWVCDAVRNGQSVADIRKEMKIVETQMKADYNVSAMPSAWRSAKSVVLSAVKEGVSLLSGTLINGKTDVETQIKAQRLSRITDSGYTPVKAYLAQAHKLVGMWAKLNAMEQASIPSALRPTGK